MDIKESDWKVFRKVRQLALERFCEQVLSEVKILASNPSDTGSSALKWLNPLID